VVDFTLKVLLSLAGVVWVKHHSTKEQEPFLAFQRVLLSKFRFNFVIPASKYKPERFIQAMNNPTKQKAEVLLFQWDDIRETRKPGSTLYTFINDSEKSVSNELINALATYGVKPVLWKSRHQYIQELSA